MVTRTASNQSTLDTALAASTGGDIVELTSWSGGMSLSGVTFTSAVTIQPAASTTINITDGCTISSCSYITFNGDVTGATLKFNTPLAQAASLKTLLTLSNSDNITIRYCDIGADEDDNATGYDNINAVVMSGCTDMLIEYCTIDRTEDGIKLVGSTPNTDVTIRNNKILRWGEDAIRFGGTRITVQRNLIGGPVYSFSGDDPHGDLISIQHSSTDSLIDMNVMTGAGPGAQFTEGVFVSEVTPNGPAQTNLTITQNIVLSQNLYGITINDLATTVTDSGCVIKNNLTINWNRGDGLGLNEKKIAYIAGWSGDADIALNMCHHDDGPGTGSTGQIRMQKKNSGNAFYFNDYYADLIQTWDSVELTPAMVQPVTDAVTDRNRAGATDANTYGPFSLIEEWTNAADWPFDVSPPAASKRVPNLGAGSPLRIGNSMLVL